MATDRTGYIEVADVDNVIFTDSKYEDFVIYTETSNQGILLGALTSNLSTLSLRSNVATFNNRIGISTDNPLVSLEVNASDAILLPKGTNAQRPSAPQQGYVRYNTTISSFEGYGAGNTWGTLGGVKDTNLDTYISAESYPTSNDDILRFYTSNNEVMRIMPTGYIGVSNQIPSERLDLQGGNAKFNSNIYVISRLAIAHSNPTESLDVIGNTKISSNMYAMSRLAVAKSNPTEAFDITGNAKISSNLYTMSRLSIANSNPTEALDITGNAKTSANMYVMGNMGIATSNPSVTGLEVNGSTKIASNLEVVGNITIRGLTTTIDSTTVNIADNIIKINNGAVYTSNLQAGIEINRGTGYSNYYILYDEQTKYFKVGTQTNLQAVATRDDTLPSNAITFYDSSNLKYTGCNNLVYTNNNLGVGLSNPSYTTDIAGTTMMRNGNSVNSFTNNQLLFSHNLTSNYPHAIKTRHDAGTNGINNAIDFYVWQTSDAPSNIGTKQVMSVTSAGVGINTTSPSYNLDVNGTINTTTLRTGADLSLTGKTILLNTNTHGDGIIFNGTSSNQRIYYHTTHGFLTHIDTIEKWQVMSTGSLSRLTVIGSTGNVGIGNSNPSEALDVNRNIKVSSNIYALSRLGVATSNPQVSLEVNATDAILIPKGTTAQRPGAPQQGHVRYNTTTSTFEGYGSGNTWGSLGGVKDTNQDTYISAESYPTSNDDILRFYTSNNEVMRIMPTGFIGISNQIPSERLDLQGGNAKFNSNLYVIGNVSVGKSNPTTSVDILGDTAVDGNVQSTKYVVSRGIQILNRNGLSYSNTLITQNVIGLSNDSKGMNISIQNATDSNYFKFQASSNELLRITGTGNVGIGTSNPICTLDVDGSINTTGTIAADNIGIFRNRIINGDMSIDQRSAGSAVNSGNAKYFVDRWSVYQSITTGVISIQRVALTSSDVGPWAKGFKYSIKSTVTTALSNYSYWLLQQLVEGINISDFGWSGSSTGSYISISFWFRASQTGTYNVCIRNTQSWVNTFTVTSANTWAYYSFVIPPPPGTGANWNANNTAWQLQLQIGNAVKSNITATPGWTNPGSSPESLTGFTDWVTTTNNYIQFTGVQLEKGNIPTPFEFRPYTIELQLCQRYYEVIFSSLVSSSVNMGYFNGPGSAANMILPFKVNKRDVPILASGSVTANNGTLGSLFTIENIQYHIGLTGANSFWYTVTTPLAYSSEL